MAAIPDNTDIPSDAVFSSAWAETRVACSDISLGSSDELARKNNMLKAGNIQTTDSVPSKLFPALLCVNTAKPKDRDDTPKAPMIISLRLSLKSTIRPTSVSKRSLGREIVLMSKPIAVAEPVVSQVLHVTVTPMAAPDAVAATLATQSMAKSLLRNSCR
jgi:hypothetical protein